MATRLEFHIVAEGKNAQEVLAKIKKSLGDLGNEAKKSEPKVNSFGDSFKDLGLKFAAVMAAAYAVKKAFDAVYAVVARSEAIQDANAALLAFAGSADNAEKMMKAVRGAADGMLSTFDATAAATRILSLGMGDTADEAAHITKLAVSLGDAFGKEALPAVEDFTDMLATGRVMGLKAYGISVADVTERANKLMAATKGMTEAQAKENAILEIADEKLKQLEDSGYEAGDTTAKLSAAIEDLTDNLVLALGSALEPALEWATNELVALNDIASAAEATGAEYSYFETALAKLNVTAENYGEQMFIMNGQVVGAAKVMEEAAHKAALLSREENYVALAMRESAEATDILVLSMESISSGIAGKIGKAWKDYGAIVRGADESLEDFTKRQDEARDAIADTTQEMIFQTASLGLNEEATLSLARKMGLLSEEDYIVTEAARLLREEYDLQDGVLDGVILNTEGYSTAVETLATRLAGVKSPEDISIVVSTWQAEQAINTFLNKYANAKISVLVQDTGLSRSNAASALRYTAMAGNNRATGGPVTVGRSYIVGEKRPELFVPNQSGRILPNVPSGGTNVTVVYQPTISMSDRREFEEKLAPFIGAEVRRILQDSRS